MDTSKQKPDLMSSSRVAADGGKRILAHLEHGSKATAKPPRAAGWTVDGWTIGLGLLLATMCTVAWLMHDKTITPRPFAHSRSSVKEAAAWYPAEPAGREAAAVAQTEQPATIVNEATARPLPAAESHLAVTSATSPALPSARAAARTEVAYATGTMHKPAGAASTVATARQPSARASGAGHDAAAASSDTDVTLLTALVAHAAKPAVVLPERSRDVVERQEGDSTSQLLARCKQLGLIEGMLCRSRICSGRWDADPACNAPSR